jgi:hypothetical protein
MLKNLKKDYSIFHFPSKSLINPLKTVKFLIRSNLLSQTGDKHKITLLHQLLKIITLQWFLETINHRIISIRLKVGHKLLDLLLFQLGVEHLDLRLRFRTPTLFDLELAELQDLAVQVH